jgi:hypothetical protein
MCADPKALAKDVIDIDEVRGLSIPSENNLVIETQHFGVVHAKLPGIIVDNSHNVWGIDNPDDDLESILHYLTGGS